jgi:hypothetical protein
MLWPSYTISSWPEFTDFADKRMPVVATPESVAFLFRGQADSDWSLIPSLARVIEGRTVTAALDAEALAVEEFKQHAHLHLPSSIVSKTSDFTGWWTLMQHYRAPTRLLDWTASPYVAAYFAVEDHWLKNGAIWLFGVKELDTQMTAKYGEAELRYDKLESIFRNAGSPPQLLIVRRDIPTDRMIAQQGGFTACRQPLYDHAQAVEDVGCNPAFWQKIIIPAALKPQFLRRLRSMNITANALFPGIDGVGRSVAELIRLT